MQIVGRQNELKIFEEAMQSTKSEMIAVIGRRRVGKTFLIRKGFSDAIVFDFSGTHNVSSLDHIERFNATIKKSFKPLKKDVQGTTWFTTFDLLESKIETAQKPKRKHIIFLDELPWIVGTSSTFMNALSSFWNNWAMKREDIILVVSGSATSWMVKKIFKSKGGLFGRTTRLIKLFPFNLHDCELFFKSKKINLSKESILELYTIFGGIPYYLDLVGPNLSINQVVDQLLFNKSALLNSEFNELFESLFEEAIIHKKVVKSLAQNTFGLTRNEIIVKIKHNSGSNISNVLEDLMTSGFISALDQIDNKVQNKKYKLTDPFILFYLKYVENKTIGISWNRIATKPTWKSWSGLAFENLCYNHTNQILQGLNILGVNASIYMWHKKGNNEMHGGQIDMIIDRDDNVIHMCELKYYKEPFVVTKEIANKIKDKISSFNYFEKRNKNIFVTIISPYGIKSNVNSNSIVNHIITMNDLFRADLAIY